MNRAWRSPRSRKTPDRQERRAPLWYGLTITKRLLAARFRALAYRALGSDIGAKCLLGHGVRLDYPAGIRLGRRCELESDVWLKLVSPAAVLTVGDHSFLGRGVEIDVAERVTIGAHVLLAPGVFITDHTHNIQAGMRVDLQGCTNHPVEIGEDVWIGTRAVVLPGVVVGAGAVIGAGAVVRRDVDPGTIVAGVPARVVGERRRD
jgi:acetyltransferase-like isoleucine patch superfamily enzyme